MVSAFDFIATVSQGGSVLAGRIAVDGYHFQGYRGVITSGCLSPKNHCMSDLTVVDH